MIFCVEDDNNIRDLLVYTLETTGFHACGLADSQELWKALAQEEPDPDSWNYDSQEEPEQPSGQEQPEAFHYEEEKKEEHPFQDTDIWDEE